ncbi:MAG: TonB-dependent receptor [Bacteroidota bacterium]
MKFKFSIIRLTLQAAIVLLFPVLAVAQSPVGAVKGRVANDQEAPMPLVNISLPDLELGTASDDNGNFTLDNIPAGTHQLAFSLVGYRIKYQTITVEAGKTTDLGAITMQQATYAMDEVVVTATRTARHVEDVPIPVTVISGEQIRDMGSMRLSDVLAEQAGLVIVSDHGNGVQVQGFNSDYTMIMINGQQVIGRTSGTLELDRITVNNIEQIEITKGPSSSLYGSEALAGVINIITKEPEAHFSTSVRGRYRTYNTVDLSADVEMKREDLGATIHVNRYSSDGYDLTPESISQTASEFHNYTVSGSLTYRTSTRSRLRIDGRYFTEDQNDRTTATIDNETQNLKFEGNQNDWSIAPTFTYDLSSKTKLTLHNHTMGYNTRSDYYFESDGTRQSDGYFNQRFNRSEGQADIRWATQQVLTAGGGHILETLKSDRYEGTNSFNTVYAFVQNEWTPLDKRVSVIAGARFDAHSEYSTQLSPKLAAHFKWTKWLTVKASAGTGFKAPDFRQLFLNFTNPTVGYSVFGSSIVQDGMNELEAQGQIQSILIDPSTIEEIQAESSVAFNVGFDLKPHRKLTIRTNVFRNDIQDLIEASPIALKTNGQQVFTYFNLDRVYTQGLESEARYQVLPGVRVSAAYQYLEAKDKDVVDALNAGNVFASDPETGQTVRVNPSDYGGLFNRSKHSGTFKIFHTNDSLNYSVSFRAVYRGRFGFGDLNNNSILDTDAEYSDGYVTVHAAATKYLMQDRFSVQLGVDNLFDTTNQYTPSLPGRLLYVSVALRFTKQQPTTDE